MDGEGTPEIHLLNSRWAPLVFGLLTVLIVGFVWGSLNPVPLIHDEASYLLQARIFASGHWTAPGRPLPQFFEQFHVLVTPVLASKYPPGHALALVPGIWLGFPALMPLMLGGMTGALIYFLARRLAGASVALLTWFLWVSAPGTLLFHASYFSEITTGTLWLAAWWALLAWRRSARRGWLFMVAACVSWGAITRPLTMLAFAVPVGLVVLYFTCKRRTWKDLLLASILGCAILLLLPIQSVLTTGQWRTSPYQLYTRLYFPYDKPGFHVDQNRPTRSLPSDMFQLSRLFLKVRMEHKVENLPGILFDRMREIDRDLWSGWRSPLRYSALLGVFLVTPEGAFALVTSLLLVLSYLVYAHQSAWTLYYLEAEPVLSFVAALGLVSLIGMMAGILRAAGIRSRRGFALSVGLLYYLMVVWAVPRSIINVMQASELEQRLSVEARLFRAAIARLPTERSIVFVRYGPRHDMHRSLIWNEPDLDHAPVWVVYDRGSENGELMKLAPQRSAYLYEESKHKLTPLARPPIDGSGNR